MLIGVPKEIKDHESRVGVTPAGVKALTEAGHKVLVEHNAGTLSALPDDDYQAAGAEIVGGAPDIWRLADMIVKVKEPTEKEYRYFRPDLLLFTYLHLAPLIDLTDALVEGKVTGIAYETVRDRANTLPLLTPMSEVAGRLSVQIGAQYLTKEHGGRGLLLGGVLIPGAAAPKIVTRAMVDRMKRGAVVVDVAIDQGGCIETARPTTHTDPSFEVSGVIHYCVTNMPAAVPNTSTLALTNATFPYVLRLASHGAKAAIQADPGIAEGVNTYAGHLTYAAVAQAQGRNWMPVTNVL